MAMNKQRRTSNINNIVTYDTLKNVTIPANLTVQGLTSAGFVKTDANGLFSVDTGAYLPIPSQTGNSGKFLSTNGSTISWQSVPQDINIYNNDGTLTGNRVVSLDSKQLIFRDTNATLSNYTYSVGVPTGVTAPTWPSSFVYEGQYNIVPGTGPQIFNTRVWGRNTSATNNNLWVQETFADITSESTSFTNIYNQTFFTGRGSALDTSTATAAVMRGIWSSIGHRYAGSQSTTVQINTNNIQSFYSTIVNYIGNVSNAYGYFSSLSQGSLTTSQTNTLTNHYGFYAEATIGSASGGSSTVTNYYGLFLNTPTVGATGVITNRWGVYAPDSAMSHYLNGNVVIGTTTLAGYKLDVSGTSRLANTLSSGFGTIISTTQTQANSTDVGDGAVSVSHSISATSATNELVIRAMSFGSNNNLTGGGAVTNHRVWNVASSTQTGSITTDLDQIFIERGNQANGTVTNNRAIRVNTMQGTNRAGFACAALAGTNNVYALLGTVTIPTGNWGIYQSESSFSNHFNGNTIIGGTTDAGFKFDVIGTARLYPRGAINGGFEFTFNDVYNIMHSGSHTFLSSNLTLMIGAGSNSYTFLGVNKNDVITPILIGYNSWQSNLYSSSAILDIRSTTKGFLQPRMTTTQRDAISSPATGLSVYNTTTNTSDFYNGTSWVSLAAGNIYTADGTLTGNRTVTMGSYTLSFTKDITVNSITVGRGNSSVASNVVVGETSGTSYTTGTGNVAIGYRAVTSITTQVNNIGIGYDAFRFSTSSRSVGIGFESGYNMTGTDNVGVGQQTLKATTGIYNVAVGVIALRANTTGSSNVAIGAEALLGNTTGNNNTAIGIQSLNSNNSSSNVSVGYQTMYSSTAAQNNVVIGYTSGWDVSTADKNTFVGYNTGRGITTGRANTILGSVNGLTSTLSNNIILADGDGNMRLAINGSGDTVLGGTTTLPTFLGYKLDVQGTGRFTNTLTVTKGASNYITFEASANGTSPYFQMFYSGVVDRYISIASDSTDLVVTSALLFSSDRTVAGAQGIIGSNILATAGFGSLGGSLLLNGTSNNIIQMYQRGVANRGVMGYAASTSYFQIRTGGATTFSNGTLSTIFDNVGSVGIGGITSVNGSAILQVDSSTKGFLPPRMTGAQVEAIASPAEGLLAYATNAGSGAVTSKGWWGYDGATWVKLN